MLDQCTAEECSRVHFIDRCCLDANSIIILTKWNTVQHPDSTVTVSHNFVHAHTAVTLSLQVHFINGSPMVEGNTIRADIVATVPTANLLCELLGNNQPPMIANCEW